jgi:peptidoglycan/xylan/chitin deacetylase (PgdA/CDA1 family)
MQTEGHEIAYHSKNHIDLRKVSESTFHEETAEQAAEYKQAGIELGAFAFPFGFSGDAQYFIKRGLGDKTRTA